MLASTDHYWLKNAHIPACLLDPDANLDITNALIQKNGEDLLWVDLEIREGAIARIQPADQPTPNLPFLDLKGGMVWPCFVDLHTHLDKGHIWDRAPNPDGSFDSALKTVRLDSERYWDVEDVYRRMEFGLKCSYAHGTQAIRTHIDALGDQATISLSAFKALQAEWRDRLLLQAVTLVPPDYFLTPAGEKLADQMAEVGGLLGGFVQMHPDLPKWLDRIFALAQERGLDLDFHTDENNRPDSMTLRYVAEASLRNQFTGQVVCGHCCSLSVQSSQVAETTMGLVKQANLGIVSLPPCNLYLQDRQPGRTPRWRGVTLLHELNQQGIPVALANDNCRDPFHGFGDHDLLDVFTLSTRIGHLDRPYQGWARAVTSTAAALMGVPKLGVIATGLPANLILFKARSYSELLSRSQRDRIVLRNGKSIDTTLPDYSELDNLQGFN